MQNDLHFLGVDSYASCSQSNVCMQARLEDCKECQAQGDHYDSTDGQTEGGRVPAQRKQAGQLQGQKFKQSEMVGFRRKGTGVNGANDSNSKSNSRSPNQR